MRTIHRTIVSAIIISKDGKILLGKKDPKRQIYDPDCWHIPGGVDKGEKLEDGLQRELLEELDLDISDGESRVKLIDDKGKGEGEKILKSGDKVWAIMQYNVFQVNIDKNVADIHVAAKDDLIELQWVALKHLHKYKQTPPSVELFKRVKIEQLAK